MPNILSTFKTAKPMRASIEVANLLLHTPSATELGASPILTVANTTHPSNLTQYQTMQLAKSQQCYYHYHVGINAKHCHEPCKHFNGHHAKERHRNARIFKTTLIRDKNSKTYQLGKREKVQKPLNPSMCNNPNPTSFSDVNAVRIAASPISQFCADSGSECSILPRSYAYLATKVNPDSKTPMLIAANKTAIRQYGTRRLRFFLSDVGRNFEWNFIIADVAEPLLGRDFLSHHDLLKDSKNNRLLERQRQYRVQSTSESRQCRT